MAGTYEDAADTYRLDIVPESEGITPDGYVTVATNFGRMLEHRAVMQQRLGRGLSDTENVHHVNGSRTDNRLENLELWSTSQPSGQRVPDKMAWARDLIARYEPLGF